MVRTRISYCWLALLFVVPSPTCYAQRYLSEFVGSSTLKSSTATRQLASSLAFDALDNRRLQGDFALSDPFRIVSDAFSADGTLAASGNCNVQLQKTSTSGGLNLVEIPLDDTSFALIGKVTVNYSSAGLLSAGKYSGGLAVLRPVADGVPITSHGLTSLALVSDTTGATSVHGLGITSVHSSNAVSGVVTGTGAMAGFNFTVSASPRWTYMVGQNSSRFLVLRVPSSLSLDGELDAFEGEYTLYDASGKITDTGSIAGR